MDNLHKKEWIRMSPVPPASTLWRRLLTIAVTAALFTAVTAALLRLTASPATPTEDTSTVTGESLSATAAPSAAPCAYLGEWEGRLAVFRTPDAPPEEVCDVFLATLPAEEQRLLRARIPTYSEEELRRLLEDYTG